MEPGPQPIASLDERLAAAFAADCARIEEYEGVEYTRVSADSHGLPRGTVILDGRVVPSFPSIGRIFVLDEGVQRAFDGPFWAEEKIDGYNVRVVRSRRGATVRDLPFTRGGFVCPFTEDRLADLVDLGPLFDAHPNLIVCGEVAGPDNPYIDTRPHRARDALRFFAFDLMRVGHDGFVPLEERDALLARFGVPVAPVLGRFTAGELPRLRRALLALDRDGGEGVVLKPPGAGVRVKYTTPSINLADILIDAPLLAELTGEFFVARILRLVLGYEDMGLSDELPGVAKRLGEGFVLDFLDTLRTVRRGGVVAKNFAVEVHSDAAADRVLRHLNRASKKIQVTEVGREHVGGRVRLTFRKMFQGSTSRLKGLLEGQHIVD